jgi:hypothetical protein
LPIANYVINVCVWKIVELEPIETLSLSMQKIPPKAYQRRPYPKEIK